MIILKNVGVLTWHYFGNFGSALQAFAMKEILQNLGENPKVLNYRGENYGIADFIKDKMKSIINNMNFNSHYYPFIEFQDKYLKQSKILWNRDKLQKYVSKMDAVICGSDQIWAPNVFNPIYMLDFFENKDIKKISYAASIGLPDIPMRLIETYKRLLSDFDYISVREEAGFELLKTKMNIKARVVLDPTFMLDVEEYNKIAKKPKEDLPDRFIFCYFLNENNNYKEAVKKLNTNRLPIIGISRDEKNDTWIKGLHNIGPSEFLWLISNSEKVFTDSYHGTIFSILYSKDFYTFERFKERDSENQNTRIFQLKKYFDLDERIVKSENVTNSSEKVDYQVISEKLSVLRKYSKDFLVGALNG